jgi:hypothetical protein
MEGEKGRGRDAFCCDNCAFTRGSEKISSRSDFFLGRVKRRSFIRLFDAVGLVLRSHGLRGVKN